MEVSTGLKKRGWVLVVECNGICDVNLKKKAMLISFVLRQFFKYALGKKAYPCRFP
jgi:hypothetical protein